jgi:flagellar hook assembly protein FlgD
VDVSFLNHGSSSVLRTITVLNQPSGNVTVFWDGRADNGMLVAPGGYTVSVRVTDAQGGVVVDRLLTMVDY